VRPHRVEVVALLFLGQDFQISCLTIKQDYLSMLEIFSTQETVTGK